MRIKDLRKKWQNTQNSRNKGILVSLEALRCKSATLKSVYESSIFWIKDCTANTERFLFFRIESVLKDLALTSRAVAN